MPSSCPPPRMCAGSFSPCRTYSAPMPLGAWTLCPLTDIMSAPSVLAENGSFRKPCTASVWRSAPDFAARSARATPAMSVTAPVSLLTIISVTSAVSSRSASRTASTETAPALSGERSVISQPSRASFSSGWRTASCSTAEEMMCRPTRRWRCAPSRMAQLSLSVPPEVKYTSLGAHPSAAASFLRESSSTARASRPSLCVEPGLPYSSVITLYAASAASGHTRVVAALSR